MRPSPSDGFELDEEFERSETLYPIDCIQVLIKMQITYSENFQPEGCKTMSPGVTMGVGLINSHNSHIEPRTNYWKAGTVFHELYQFAEEHGITVVGGSDRTVGPSGGWVIVSFQLPTRSQNRC